jgi:four helix bundle protein
LSAHEYQKLEVWKKSVELAISVYEICKQLPKSELYVLSDQMKRAAVSVPSNIAEGQKRFTTKDTVHFCTVALGSIAELETQLIISQRIYDLDTAYVLSECAIISRMLHALIKSLRDKA